MIKSNEMATTVGHCENCLYDIAQSITDGGSLEQREALHNALGALEDLYFLLQEEEHDGQPDEAQEWESFDPDCQETNMKRLFNHDLVSQVREFMERFDVYQIAAKMNLDPYMVQAIIDFINGVT